MEELDSVQFKPSTSDSSDTDATTVKQFKPSTSDSSDTDATAVKQCKPSTSDSSDTDMTTIKQINDEVSDAGLKESNQPTKNLLKWRALFANKSKPKEEVERYKNSPSTLAAWIKFFAFIFLSAAITILFVATKISFIHLCKLLNSTSTADTPLTNDPKSTGQFLVIFLAIEVPYFLLLLRALWEGVFANGTPWPSKRIVAGCFTSGFLESAGIVMLALKVLPHLSIFLGALTMSNVIFVTVVVNAGIAINKRKKWYTIFFMILSILAALGVFGVTLYTIYLETNEITNIYFSLGSIFCLSLAWLPCFLQYINQHSYDYKGLTGQNRQDNVNREQQTPKRKSGAQEERGVSWKTSFILNLIKIVTTAISSFFLFYLDQRYKENFTEESHRAFNSAWSFASTQISSHTWIAFGVNLCGSFLCYFLVYTTHHINMKKGCMVIPFLIYLPVTIAFTTDNPLCNHMINNSDICQSHSREWCLWAYLTMLAMILLQLLSLVKKTVKPDKISLQAEEKYFWISGHIGAVADAWLLLNSRRTTRKIEDQREGKKYKTDKSTPTKTKVYICTTMCREDESEMKQLLQSLSKINEAQAKCAHIIEAHIIFDGGVKGKNLSEFALTLISLLRDTLGIELEKCEKITTPYGLNLKWDLPTSGKKMVFSIHLKDNTLVKNKKRWSQVMYMSYVLYFRKDNVDPDEEVYILTTDADIKFTPESVETLLDLMCRDPKIGAVCARTHPMGSGPIVWYQIFEYAIGHWFQKASEHVMGSVLCAPGCFSVYRCQALKTILLSHYCKEVESSFDFLTKDMGEDRWLCTLLIQNGWRIEYCAASENSTNCPSAFEEFYKQRRRWIASTLANLMLIIKDWKYITLYNSRISFLFLIYQGILLSSTLISPSTVMLVVAGGIDFAWGVNAVAAVVLQIVLCVLFALACFRTSPKTQILLAKFYTFLYAAVMCGVAIGTAEQVVTDLSDNSIDNLNNTGLIRFHALRDEHISLDVPVSVTTIYFALIASIFVLTGFLHLKEMICLIYGIVFLLCLPSAYLVLIIYSICNLTDSSWGTREGDTAASTVKKRTSWREQYKNIFLSICFCCRPTTKPKSNEGVDSEEVEVSTQNGESDKIVVHTNGESEDGRQEYGNNDISISVEAWLHEEFEQFENEYTEIFKRHGYNNTMFIRSLTETDLKRMGIKKRSHIYLLMNKISLLPDFEIEVKVPTNVTEWLKEIGLSKYEANFRRNCIQSQNQMEVLKKFNRKTIEKELGITKEGHIRRLLNALKVLRRPSELQQNIIHVRQKIDHIDSLSMEEKYVDEFNFWSELKTQYVGTHLKSFGIDSEVKVKLAELRNSWLLVMAVANSLWLILVTTLATKADLTLLGANPIGLLFLFIFGFVLFVQFLAMLFHRFFTLCHYLARAPYCCGTPMKNSWSFKEEVEVEHSTPSGSDTTQLGKKDVKILRDTLQSPGELVINEDRTSNEDILLISFDEIKDSRKQTQIKRTVSETKKTSQIPESMQTTAEVHVPTCETIPLLRSSREVYV